MFRAKVYDLTDDEIDDLYLYGCVVWFHPESLNEKAHYHVAECCSHPEVLEEKLYCLCDRIVIAVQMRDIEWSSLICTYGKKIYPKVSDDNVIVEV